MIDMKLTPEQSPATQLGLAEPLIITIAARGIGASATLGVTVPFGEEY